MISLRTRFLKNDKVVEGQVEGLKAGATLIETLESVGMKIPYGCRSGACAVCRVRVTKGQELLKERGLIEEDTHSRVGDQDNIRLACQTEVIEALEGAIHIECTPEIPERPDDDTVYE